MENENTEMAPYTVFDDIDPHTIDRIVSIGEEIEFSRDDIIFAESSPCSDLYVIKNGRVRVEIASVQPSDAGKHHVELAVLRKGEIFGEIAFLEGHRRSAQVTAIDDTIVIRINRDHLYDYFKEDYQTGYIFMRNLACVLSKRLEDLNFLCRNLTNGGI